MKVYQHNYASGRPQMYDKGSRIVKAKNIITILSDYHNSPEALKSLKLLDVGSSSGIMDNYLAKYFDSVTGIDIDTGAVNFAKKTFKKKGLTFLKGDAMNINFPNNTFDVVICAQVYEHVPDSRKLFVEIHRVLKKDGICYLAALNKLWPIEPHYNLLFLSWLPKTLANYYLRILNKGKYYYENILSYWQLRSRLRKFEIVEYTSIIVSDPRKFGYSGVSGINSVLRTILAPLANYLSPTFIWILVKRD